MDLIPELEKRRAYRAISDAPISEDAVARILEAASLAPSCYNNQPWRLIAVGGEKLAALRETLTEGNRWARRAPLIVAVSTKAALDCRLDEGRDYAFFDAGQAALALQLQAFREGLFAHPIAGYSAGKARKLLGLPEDFTVICLVVVGYPGDDSLLADWQKERERGGRQRKPLGETAFRDEFGTAWA